jgi:aquaporin NIP
MRRRDRGCGAARMLLGSDIGFAATVPMLPIAQSFVVEMGYTGVLGFVIMAVATDERTPLAIAPFALGITIAAGALVTGPLTGGSFNPARSLGSAVMENVWTAHWLCWVAPILGMLLGMHLYEALRSASAPSAPRTPTGVGADHSSARLRFPMVSSTADPQKQ